MRNDIRIYTDLPHHYKTIMLEKMAGGAGVWALIKLWIFAAGHCPEDGILRMSDIQIEAVCNWNTEGIRIVSCFLDCGFIEKIEDGYLIHDWIEMQPFVSSFAERSRINTENVKKGWARRKGMNSELDTNRKRPVNDSLTKRSTPTILPTILPTYLPTNLPTKQTQSDGGKSKDDLPDERFLKAVKKLFPNCKNGQLKPQAETLEKIERIDGCKLDDLMPVLNWAVNDKRDGFNWSSNFLSCAPLRARKPAGDAMKWEKIMKSYQQQMGKNKPVKSERDRVTCSTCQCSYLKSEEVCPHCGGK